MKNIKLDANTFREGQGIGASIVIRTLNEARFLPVCLKQIDEQEIDIPFEIILVDSGSSDCTIRIGKSFGCRIIEIERKDFSFGRALNMGISQARWPIIVAISAHCIPVSKHWLSHLVEPIREGVAEMVYGSHIAPKYTRSSEISYFQEKYSQRSGLKIRPLMNNGNSAFLRIIWEARPFDERLSAQEDMEFSLWHMTKNSFRLYYIRSAMVEHHHNDKNKTLFRRLYRELSVEFYLGQKTFGEMALFFLLVPVYIVTDLVVAHRKGVMIRAAKGILGFRAIQSVAYIYAFRTHIHFVTQGQQPC